jgi:DNA (cytosine-5)-methyltransferase 1
MNELALFAGAGGGILGGHLLGWRTVCAVEWEPYAACVLAARQNDGVLPPFPIWDDVQTFDGRPWQGIVDVVSGGFPCQDISAAGKGAGIDGERSGMWREMARIIHEVRPRFVFVENSPMLTSRGLGTVLGDLASMGFDAKWGVLGAADVGAPHQRDRIWILAHTVCQQEYRIRGTGKQGWNPVGRDEQAAQQKNREASSDGFGRRNKKTNATDTDSFDDAMRGDSQNYEKSMGIGGDEPRGSFCDSGSGCKESAGKGRSMAHSQDERNVRGGRQLGVVEEEHHHRGSQTNGGGKWWEVEPDLGRVADGVAARVDRLKAIGNGQVPEVARTAWSVM